MSSSSSPHATRPTGSRRPRRPEGGVPGRPVIVADDASSDGTSDLALARGAEVVSRRRPHGKGGSMTAAAATSPRSPSWATRPPSCSATGTLAPRLESCDAGRGGRARASATSPSAPFSRRVGGGFGVALGFARWAIERRSRLSRRGADLRPAGDARRGPPRRAALRSRLRHGDGDDDRRRAGRVHRPASTSSTSSTAPRDAASRGFAHRARSSLTSLACGGAEGSLGAVILAIDQGTTGTTCLVFDREGQIAGRAYSEFEQHFPQPGLGRARRRPRSGRSRAGSPREAIADAGIDGASLDGIGITNQRETVVAWDPASGEPVHHALVWQDRRTAARCDELREAGHEGLVRERTGLVIDPYFSGTKIEWLLQNVDGRARTPSSGRSTPGSPSSSPAATSPTTRTRRGRCSSTSAGLRWDEELCALLGVDPARCRSRLRPPSSTAPPRSSAARCPVAGIAGDQQAALFGQALHPAGAGEEHVRHRQLRPAEHGHRGARAGRGPAHDGRLGTRRARPTTPWRRPSSSPARPSSGFVTGSGSSTSAAETEELAALAGGERRRLLRAGADRPGLAALGPVRARDDRRADARARTGAPGARGARGDRLPDRRRRSGPGGAAGKALELLKADGGAVANGWLMQFQADVLGAPVVVPEITETTALGAAYLAGIATGLWDVEEVEAMWREAARTSRGWAPTSARACSPTGAGRSSGRRAGRAGVAACEPP